MKVRVYKLEKYSCTYVVDVQTAHVLLLLLSVLGQLAPLVLARLAVDRAAAGLAQKKWTGSAKRKNQLRL